MEYYKKTQIGSVIIGFCLLSAAFIYSFDGPSDEFLAAFLILSIVICLFGWLTIIIDKTHLKIRMGIGLIRKTIPLKEISSVKSNKLHWWVGWGLRYYFGKIIYNVSGFKAVEITLKSGKVILLGTAEPEHLKQKIDSAKGLFS